MSITFPVNIDTTYTDRNGNTLVSSSDIFCVDYYDRTTQGIEPSWSSSSPRSIDLTNAGFNTAVTGTGWYNAGDTSAPYDYIHNRYAAWNNTDHLEGASLVTSSGYAGYSPANMVSLRIAAGWRTSNSNEYSNAAVFDMGSTKTIDTIFFKPTWGLTTANYLKGYRLGISNTGYDGDHNFEIVVSGTNEANNNLPLYHHVTASGVRYIKVYADSNYGGSNIDVGMISAFYQPSWSFWGFREVDVAGTDLSVISQDIDLTNINTLYYDIRLYISSATQNGSASVFVNGDSLDSLSWSDISSNLDSEDGNYFTDYERSVDVSSYTGSGTITFKYGPTTSYSKNFFDVYYDNFKAYPGWCYESVSSTRGSSPYFPKYSYLVSDGTGLSIIDSTNLSLWMRFNIGRRKAIQSAIRDITAIGGRIFCATSNGLVLLDFTDNTIYKYTTAGIYYRTSILNRNTDKRWHLYDDTVTIPSNNITSVACGYSSQISGGRYFAVIGTDSGVSVIDYENASVVHPEDSISIREVSVNENESSRVACVCGNDVTKQVVYIDSIEEVLSLPNDDTFSIGHVRFLPEANKFRDNTFSTFSGSGLRFVSGGVPFGIDDSVLTISGTKASAGKSYFLYDFRSPVGNIEASMDVKISDWPLDVEGGLHFGVSDGWPENNLYGYDGSSGIFLSAVNGFSHTPFENDIFSGENLDSQWERNLDPFNESALIVVGSGVATIKAKNSAGVGDYGTYHGAVVGQKYMFSGSSATISGVLRRKVTNIGTSEDLNRPIAVIFGISEGPFTGGSGNSAAYLSLYSEKATASGGLYCMGRLEDQTWTWYTGTTVSKDANDGTEDALYREWSVVYDPSTNVIEGFIDGQSCGNVDCTGFISDTFGFIFGGVSYSPGLSDYVFTDYVDEFSCYYCSDLASADKEKYSVGVFKETGVFQRQASGGNLFGKPFDGGDGTEASDWKTWTIKYDSVNRTLKGFVDGDMVGYDRYTVGTCPTISVVYDMPYMTNADAGVDIKLRNLTVSGTPSTISGSANSLYSSYGLYNAVQREAFYISTVSGVDHKVYNRNYVTDATTALDGWTVRDAPSATAAPSSWSIDTATVKQSSSIYGSWNSADYKEPYGTHLVYTTNTDILSSRTKTFRIDAFSYTNTGALGVAFCKQSNTDGQDSFKNMYYYMIDFESSGKSYLGRVDSSTPVVLSTSSGTSTASVAKPGIWNRIEVDPTDGEISIKLNGVEEHRVSDSIYTGGYVALISSKSANSRFKNFVLDPNEWREAIYETSYGITGSNAENICLWGTSANVLSSEPSVGAVASSGTLYSAVSAREAVDFDKIFDRAGSSNTGYKCSVGCSYSGDSLLLDYWINKSTGQELYYRNFSADSPWRAAQVESYGFYSGRSYRVHFLPDHRSNNIYLLSDDYFYSFDTVSGTIARSLDSPTFAVLASSSLEGVHFCSSPAKNIALLCGDATSRPSVVKYDMIKDMWEGAECSLEDYSTDSKLNLIYSEVNDSVYIIPDNAFGTMQRAPLERMSWEDITLEGEFPGYLKEYSFYSFYRPYDECIYILSYSGDTFANTTMTKYDIKRSEWSYSTIGATVGTDYYGGCYAPDKDVLYIISGNNNTSMYRYYLGGINKPIERFWTPSSVPESSTKLSMRKISWSGNSLVTDDTFTDSSRDPMWYDYVSSSTYVSFSEGATGLVASLSNTNSTVMTASRTSYTYFPPADFDVSVKVKITSFPTPTELPGYNYFRIGFTDYLCTRSMEDIYDTSVLGVNGVWMAAVNEDDLTSRYTLWKREQQSDTIYSSTDYIDFWGNDGTSLADFRTWRFVYNHSYKKLTAYVDGNLIGEATFSGRGFDAGMYFSIYLGSYGLDAADTSDATIKDLTFSNNANSSLVNNGYLLLDDTNSRAEVYYDKVDSLLRKGPPYVFESQTYISSSTLVSTVYVYSLFDVHDGSKRVLVALLYVSGVRKIGIYTSGNPHLATSYTYDDCEWNTVKTYRLVVTSSTVEVYVDDILTVSSLYSNMPSSDYSGASFGSKALVPEREYYVSDTAISYIGDVSVFSGSQSSSGSYLRKGWGLLIENGLSNKVYIDISNDSFVSTDVFILYDAYVRPSDVPITIYHSGVISLPISDSYTTNPITTVNDNVDEDRNVDSNATTIDIDQSRMSDGTFYSSFNMGRVGSGFVYLGTYSSPTLIALSGDFTEVDAASLSSVYIKSSSYSAISRKATARTMFFRYGVNETSLVSTNGTYGALNVIDLESKTLLDYYTESTSPGIIDNDVSSFDVHL